jgi:hypothetical protein
MHNFLVTLMFASVFASNNSMAQHAGMILLPYRRLPSATRNPRKIFAPDSAADQLEQRLPAFGAEQHKLDELTDKKLNIFRC